MKAWMKKAKRRLCSQAGESLGETLVGLLIAALALTMLAGAMMTSSGIITKSKAALNTYQDGIEQVVTRSITPEPCTVDFTQVGSASITSNGMTKATETAFAVSDVGVSFYGTAFTGTPVGIYVK